MRPTILIMVIASLLAVRSFAQTVYTPDNLPKVHLTDKTRYVCNPSGILSTAACDSIDSWLYALEQQTGIETVVAVVPSIGDADCFDFCHELLNSWGVGKKGKDNGLVVLLDIGQGCIQFYTGYGLEGTLPDALCKRIQTIEMLPYLKEGDWDAAMTAGMKSVCGILDGSMESDTLSDADEDEWMLPTAAFLGFIIIACLIVWIAVRMETKCPYCGKHTLQRSQSRLLRVRHGVRTEEITYVCRNCGQSVVKRQDSYDSSHNNGGGAGPVIFGGGGFGRGGGGFGGSFGGSFGGGRGGGGGAGTRF